MTTQELVAKAYLFVSEHGGKVELPLMGDLGSIVLIVKAYKIGDKQIRIDVVKQ